MSEVHIVAWLGFIGIILGLIVGYIIGKDGDSEKNE